MKMASRSIDLISKKKIASVAHLFFLISKKNQICTCSTLLVFLCRCFAQLQRCFVGLNRQTSSVTHYFYGGIAVCSYPIFCLMCSCSLLFFIALIFTLLAASISHCLTTALNFHVFLPTKFISFVFKHSL